MEEEREEVQRYHYRPKPTKRTSHHYTRTTIISHTVSHRSTCTIRRQGMGIRLRIRLRTRRHLDRQSRTGTPFPGMNTNTNTNTSKETRLTSHGICKDHILTRPRHTTTHTHTHTGTDMGMGSRRVHLWCRPGRAPRWSSRLGMDLGRRRRKG